MLAWLSEPRPLNVDSLGSRPLGAHDPGDDVDVARFATEQEVQLCLASRAIHNLRYIDTAFLRLEDSTYGRCEECTNEIPDERLELLPFARVCVDCQRNRERHSHTLAQASVLLIISASVEEAEPNGPRGRGIRGGFLARDDVPKRPGGRSRNANAQRRNATAPKHQTDR
jgi:RNA polymerase-binding transcription factor DksA